MLFALFEYGHHKGLSINRLVVCKGGIQPIQVNTVFGMASIAVRFIHWFIADVTDINIIVCFVCRLIETDAQVIFYHILESSINKLHAAPIHEGGDYIWSCSNGYQIQQLLCLSFRLLLEKWNFQFPKPYQENIFAELDENGLLKAFLILEEEKEPSVQVKALSFNAELSTVVEFSLVTTLNHDIDEPQKYTIGDIGMDILHKNQPHITIKQDTLSQNNEPWMSLEQLSWPCEDARVISVRKKLGKAKLLCNWDAIVLNEDIETYDYNNGSSASFTVLKKKLKWLNLSYMGPEMGIVYKKSSASEPIFVNDIQMVCTSPCNLRERIQHVRYYNGYWTPAFHTSLAQVFSSDSSKYLRDLITSEEFTYGGIFYLKYPKKVFKNVHLEKYDFTNYLPRILLQLLERISVIPDIPLVLYVRQLLFTAIRLEKDNVVRQSIKSTLTTLCGYLKWTNPLLFQQLHKEGRQFMLEVVDFIEKNRFGEVVLIAFDGFIIRVLDDITAPGTRTLPSHINDVPLKFEGSFTDGLFKSVNQTILIDRNRQDSTNRYHCEVRGICSSKSEFCREISLDLLHDLSCDSLEIAHDKSVQSSNSWRRFSRTHFSFHRHRQQLLITSWLLSTENFSINSSYRKRLIYIQRPQHILLLQQRKVSAQNSKKWSDIYEEEASNHISFLEENEKVSINYTEYVHLIFKNLAIFKFFFPAACMEAYNRLLRLASWLVKEEESALFRLPSHPLEKLQRASLGDYFLAAVRTRFGNNND